MAKVSPENNGKLLVLLEAVMQGNFHAVKSVIDNVEGINPDMTNNNNETLLHLAVKSVRSDIVRLLREKGASLHKKDMWGLTPLGRARNLLVRVKRKGNKQGTENNLTQIISYLESEERKERNNLRGMTRVVINLLKGAITKEKQTGAERFNRGLVKL